jgi:hypothetical protein
MVVKLVDGLQGAEERTVERLREGDTFGGELLSVMGGEREVCYYWGPTPSVERFRQLAHMAGNLLPVGMFPQEPINAFTTPPVMPRSATACWIGFVFGQLRRHPGMLFCQSDGKDGLWGQLPCSFLNMTLFDASALAIDLGKLTTDPTPISADTASVPGSSNADSTPPEPPNASSVNELFAFNLSRIFRCAVELGAAVNDHTGGASSREAKIAGERLLRVLNPRDALFPSNFEWAEFRALREIGETWTRGDEPRPGWEQELDLADTSPAARQALLTIGLALADLRGDMQWHDRGRGLLSAGTWNLWHGMGPADRDAVRHLLQETHRLWGWPADPRGEPAAFTGPTATLSDGRILTPGWRTSTTDQTDNAFHNLLRTDRQRGLALAERLYPNLPLKAPEGAPAPVAAAYEAVAAALVHAWYLRLHVLPVAGDGDPSDFSERTRQRRLELPWGAMTTGEAAQQVVRDRDQAKAEYARAEAMLRAAVEPGGRCATAGALAWASGVADICEDAAAGRRPWDQAACAIYTAPEISLVQVLEEMRRQACRAIIQLQVQTRQAGENDGTRRPDAIESLTPPPPPPTQYLMSWREILDAIERENNPEGQRQVRALNTRFNGPIILPKKGGQPKVTRDKLLAWWNGLEEQFRELEQKQADTQATLQAEHKYGKDETVLPDISGHVKKRRGTKSDQ